jgi:predicted Rossmann fold flavoprotein
MCYRSEILVVGAGAAGLTAGIAAAETARACPEHCPVTLLDTARTIGAKILVSGGGRCNVTHYVVRPNDYNGSRNPVRNVLLSFDQRRTIDWFARLGVELKQESTGKLFPISDKARTVLDALLKRSHELGINLRTGHRVTQITQLAESDARFRVDFDSGTILANRIILATGGRSLPRTGSDGGGWAIAQKLGHTVTDTYPALVPLVLDGGFFHGELSGLSHEAGLTTWVDDQRIDERTGSLLWTHFGVSGPVVMDASRFVTGAMQRGKRVRLLMNCFVDASAESIDARLLKASQDRPRAEMGTVLGEWLPAKLSSALLKHAGVDANITMSHLSKEFRRKLAGVLTALPLPVQRDRGWNYAEVTAGGVPLSEIDYRTMESRKVPGLYFAGEILDVDGRIGGFNFQWAWSSGWVAGQAAAKAISMPSP